MNKYAALKDELNNLVKRGSELSVALKNFDNIKGNSLIFFLNNYQQWYTQALLVIKQLLPDRVDDFTIMYRNERRKNLTVDTYTIYDALRGIRDGGDFTLNERFNPASATVLVVHQTNILESCIAVFDSKIADIQTLLQADMFDSEIDTAKHLVKKGFLRSAGAICGVVLEKHFAGVCNNRNITVKKRANLADYNDVLKDNSVYDVVEWRKTQHLIDIRNLCDHDKGREPSKEELEELIMGTDKIIKTIF